MMLLTQGLCLHEAIPLTGTIASGTYSDENIKTFSHGMFESVFDYPFLSSSANHVFDITHGYSNPTSNLSGTGHILKTPRRLIFTIKWLLCLLVTMQLDQFKNLIKMVDIAGGGTKHMEEVFFIKLLRVFFAKDEIKKDSFRLTFASSLQGGTPYARTRHNDNW